MKYRISLILAFLLIPLVLQARKVYSVKYESQADIRVFVVQYVSQCDLKVYLVEYESQADEPGLWYFVEYESQADMKIYFVKYESQAGWRNPEKQHLLL